MQSPGGTRRQKGSGRPTAVVANHRYRALPRPGYGARGSIRKVEAAPGRPVDGGMLPPGTRTVSEREKSSYAAHLMGRLALKLSSSSAAAFKFLIPPLACALNRMGAPRDKPLGCCGEACRGFTALR
jgi:hypothetical protein